MNKEELVRKAARDSGVTIQNTKKVIDALLEAITGAVEEGDEVIIRGFGKFSQKHVKPRRIKDLQTGDALEVGPVKSMRFKPSGAVKKRFNS